MKRIALLAVIGAGLMGLPSTATAQRSTCPDVFLISPSYACVDVTGAGGELVVNDSNGCSYVNGWSTSRVPGYAGICTAKTSRGPGCNPDDPNHTHGANTGGCFAIEPPVPAAVNDALNSFPVGVVTAGFICGNANGNDPRNTTRRGCSIP